MNMYTHVYLSISLYIYMCVCRAVVFLHYNKPRRATIMGLRLSIEFLDPYRHLAATVLVLQTLANLATGPHQES